MRMPFYLYRPNSLPTSHRLQSTLVSVLAVGVTLLLYAGLLAFVLLRGQS